MGYGLKNSDIRVSTLQSSFYENNNLALEPGNRVDFVPRVYSLSVETVARGDGRSSRPPT